MGRHPDTKARKTNGPPPCHNSPRTEIVSLLNVSPPYLLHGVCYHVLRGMQPRHSTYATTSGNICNHVHYRVCNHISPRVCNHIHLDLVFIEKLVFRHYGRKLSGNSKNVHYAPQNDRPSALSQRPSHRDRRSPPYVLPNSGCIMLPHHPRYATTSLDNHNPARCIRRAMWLHTPIDVVAYPNRCGGIPK